MIELISDFVARRRWAVVGVSNDASKFGRRIFESLKGAGYEVIPVHSKLSRLDDETPVYSSVKDIAEAPEVVDIVVPPAATEQVIRDCIEAGVKRVWFQPGAADAGAIALAERNGIQVIAHGPCAMVEKKRWI